MRSVVAAAGVAVLLAGTGHTASVATGAENAANGPYREVAANEAMGLWTGIRLPPGSGTVPVPFPGSGLSSEPPRPSTPDLIAQSVYYSVPASVGDLAAWLAANPPVGGTVSGTGSVRRPGVDMSTVTVTYPPPAGVVSAETVDQVGGHPVYGRIMVRAVIEVVGERSKPAGYSIPAGVRVVTATGGTTGGTGGVGPRPTTVLWGPAATATPVAVQQMVRLIDGLPVWPPGTYSCPDDPEPTVWLRFEDGRPATAVIRGGGCRVVTLFVGDRPAVELAGGATVTAAVGRIFGAGIPARYRTTDR